MTLSTTSHNGVQQWVAVRHEPPGQVTVEVVGVPELRATAATRELALERVRALVGEWLASGKLVAMDVQDTNPVLNFEGHLDPSQPLEQEFAQELARRHREDLDCTAREDDQECSSSSSTPTT
jgi:hypothetical protein